MGRALLFAALLAAASSSVTPAAASAAGFGAVSCSSFAVGVPDGWLLYPGADPSLCAFGQTSVSGRCRPPGPQRAREEACTCTSPERARRAVGALRGGLLGGGGAALALTAIILAGGGVCLHSGLLRGGAFVALLPLACTTATLACTLFAMGARVGPSAYWAGCGARVLPEDPAPPGAPPLPPLGPTSRAMWGGVVAGAFGGFFGCCALLLVVGLLPQMMDCEGVCKELVLCLCPLRCVRRWATREGPDDEEPGDDDAANPACEQL